jgi:lysine-N-methylase
MMSRRDAEPLSLSEHPKPTASLKQDEANQGIAALNHQSESQPTYAGLFRCIGPVCEDTCCGDWDVPVDKITYQEYRTFPAEKLGSLVAHFVSECVDSPHDNLYASIRRKQDGSCPFFGTDRLCGIQKEYGAKLLTSTCSLYPRSLSSVHGQLEGSLSLSCPEAARAVLLDECSVQRAGDLFSGEFRTDNVFELKHRQGLESYFLSIRFLVTELIRDRSRPLWQRLLIISSFCSRLDDVGNAGDSRRVTRLLTNYEHALGQGPSLELDRLGPDVATRLEIAITLSDGRCRDQYCGQRFHNAFWDFIEGIGSSASVGPDEDVRRFLQANRDYFTPFVERFPFIAENYLLNYVYQHLFPFGRVGSDRFITRSMSDESALLLTQFSWLTTLLIGIAGRYGHEFSQAHVIATVQSFTRAVEHVPQVHEDIIASAKRRKLDNLEGFAHLLRT